MAAAGSAPSPVGVRCVFAVRAADRSSCAMRCRGTGSSGRRGPTFGASANHATAHQRKLRTFERPVLTVADLVHELALEGKRIAVERNGEIVPRSRYAEHAGRRRRSRWRSSAPSAAADGSRRLRPTDGAPRRPRGVKSRHERSPRALVRPSSIRWRSPVAPIVRASSSAPASTRISSRRARRSSHRARRSSRSRSAARTSARTRTRRRCSTCCRRPSSPTCRTRPAATPPTMPCARCRLARELLDGHNLVKLEVLGDPHTLFPNVRATMTAAETLVRDGFEVMVYTYRRSRSSRASSRRSAAWRSCRSLR